MLKYVNKPFNNPKIIKFMLLGNLVLIEIPSFHTFTNYVYFKGSKKNELYILLDINHYLEEGLESIFTSSIKITDDDYIQMIDNYDGEEWKIKRNNFKLWFFLILYLFFLF